MKKNVFKRGFFLRVIAAVVCMLPLCGFSQATSIVTPESHQTFQLPDPATIQTAESTQSAITAAENAAKALLADAATEKTNIAAQQTAYNKAEAEKNEYVAGITNFSKQDVEPYKTDLNNYTALGTKYTALLDKHNKAVNANNALPAKNRKAATVAALNKEKLQVDSISTQLGKWKTRLDAAKAKLDVKNATLQKQQKKYEADEQASSAKLRASKSKLSGVLSQLTTCANYAAKCKGLSAAKATGTAGSSATPGYFDSAEYKAAVTDLGMTMQKLAAF